MSAPPRAHARTQLVTFWVGVVIQLAPPHLSLALWLLNLPVPFSPQCMTRLAPLAPLSYVGRSRAVRSLGTLRSLCTVFKDLIPGYRIRSLTEKEKESKLSTEVAALQSFEQALLKNYQMYLQRLHKIIKLHDASRKEDLESVKAKARRKLMVVAVKCMCVLLLDVTHFNYRSNIIEVVVPRMNDKFAFTCVFPAFLLFCLSSVSSSCTVSAVSISHTHSSNGGDIHAYHVLQ